MKILIIRFSSIGDIVLTTPIIRCAKIQYPNAEIHFVTKEQFLPVLKANPYLTKIHVLKQDIQPLVLDLLKEKFDIVIDLHKNMRTTYVKGLLRQAFNSQITFCSFHKLNVKKWLYTNLKLNFLPDKSIVERYFACVKSIGIVNDGKGLDYFIAEEDEVKKDDIPMSHMLGFIACVIGGQHATKKMPVEQWKALVQKIQHPIILLGGKEDVDMAIEISANDPIKVYNACGKFSINESAHLVKKSKLVITHDTGLMHVAAAFQKSILSIWGNTTPAFGMFPYYGNNNVKTNISPKLSIFEVEKLACRPCSKIGYNTCPKKHFNCMKQQPIHEIIAKANEVLNTKEV